MGRDGDPGPESPEGGAGRPGSPESSVHCGFPLTALTRTCSSQFWAHTVVWSTKSSHLRREGVWGRPPGSGYDRPSLRVELVLPTDGPARGAVPGAGEYSVTSLPTRCFRWRRRRHSQEHGAQLGCMVGSATPLCPFAYFYKVKVLHHKGAGGLNELMQGKLGFQPAFY